MKAYITPDTKKKDAFWLVIERTPKSPELEAIMGAFRDEDLSDNVAYPVLEEEIEAIRDACKNWLQKEEK